MKITSVIATSLRQLRCKKDKVNSNYVAKKANRPGKFTTGD